MQEIPADLSRGVLGKPLTHHLVGPVPLERVSIELVVLWPGGVDVIQKLGAASPRRSLQVALAERADEQLRLVQPRSVGRRKAGPPPTLATRPVCLGSAGRVARIAILDQKHPAQAVVPTTKRFQ